MTDQLPGRRTALLAGLTLATMPALAACGSNAAKTAPLHQLRAPTGRTALSLAGVPNLADVVTGIRDFGNACWRANASIDKNYTASPFSIAVAFGMLRAGSRTTTGSAIDHTFGFPPGTSASGAVHPALNALTAHLLTAQPPATKPGPAVTDGRPPDPIVAIANGLFLARGSADSVQQGFLQLLAAQYGAAPIVADFTDPSAAVAMLNRWVAQQTRNRIRQLFAGLDPATLLVLANAVYLKAQWAMQFEPSATRSGIFQTAAGPVSAHLMNQTLPAATYTEGDRWQRVNVAYSDYRLSMRVVVPSGPVTELAGLRAAMTAALEPIRSDTPTSVRLTLPRWDTASDLDLTIALPKLGLTVPFSSQADFSGIAPGLFIEQAIHRANITVDELGTEAAAVTGIAIASSAAQRSAVVRADRPFAWAIVHEPTATPLFAGHVVDPGGH